MAKELSNYLTIHWLIPSLLDTGDAIK